jgi:hypothetical protein
MDDPAIDELLRTFYANISGPAGSPRPLPAEADLHHPQARLMRTGVDASGRPWIRVMTLAEYTEDTREFFATTDFYEIEVARRVERFGNIAWVRSVYEARRHPDDPQLLKRGINSIQLYNDGSRWQVVSVLWDNERPGVAVPAEWLPESPSRLAGGPV